MAGCLTDVVADRANCIIFELEWFAPFGSASRYGTVRLPGVEIELRQTIEPRHVLAEVSGTSTSATWILSSGRLRVKSASADGRSATWWPGTRRPPAAPSPPPACGESVATQPMRYRAQSPLPQPLHLRPSGSIRRSCSTRWTPDRCPSVRMHLSCQIASGGLRHDTFPVQCQRRPRRWRVRCALRELPRGIPQWPLYAWRRGVRSPTTRGDRWTCGGRRRLAPAGGDLGRRDMPARRSQQQ